MPPELITQWADEIEKITPGRLKIMTYCGRKREAKRIWWDMIPNDEVLDPSNEDNVLIVILTSYQTKLERHGPEKLKKRRRSLYKKTHPGTLVKK